MAQVIDIADEDDDIMEIPIDPLGELTRNLSKSFKCLNPDCRSTSNLVRASANAKRYFGVELYPKKTRICRDCLSIFRTEKREIVKHVKHGNNILHKDIQLYSKTVVMPDSDSDRSDHDEESDDSELEYETSEIGGSSNGQSFCQYGHPELRSAVLDILSKYDLRSHISDGYKLIDKRLKDAERKLEQCDLEYASIENEIVEFREDFYDTFDLPIKYETPLDIGPKSSLYDIVSNCESISPRKPEGSADIIEEGVVTNSVLSIPHNVPFVRLSPNLFDQVYLMRQNRVSKWVAAVINYINTTEVDTLYTVTFSKEKDEVEERIVKGNALAYFNECSSRIPVGTRVIALYTENKISHYYLGIVAECPYLQNKYRYLIFFDGGFPQYVFHNNIRVVISSSMPVWKDVIEESQEFIKNYLDAFPERPMLRLQKYDMVKTELEGIWWKTQVMKVDASLFKINFMAKNKTEWIYRGSTRLYPLFLKKISLKIKSENPAKTVRRRTLPVGKMRPIVEYCIVPDDEDPPITSIPLDSNSSVPMIQISPSHQANDGSPTGLAVSPQFNGASSPNMQISPVPDPDSLVPSANSLPISEKLRLECGGYVMYLDLDSSYTDFTPHVCSAFCIQNEANILAHRDHSPLMKPILVGFRRLFASLRKKTCTQSECTYVSPCGRRLRSIKEIMRYLKLTASKLQIDQFSFSQGVNILRSWEPFNKEFYNSDITQGLEDVKISCVNSIDSVPPPPLVYSNIRMPSERVMLNINPDYLICCSCEDDCKSSSKCECRQLTVDAAKKTNVETGYRNLGYINRRLHEQLVTGIFECNSKCRCQMSCLNRVVQHPIRQRLQLFKTAQRGWGVRTLNDIPKGGFICVYVGRLLTEEEANESGRTDGADDYFADLDFIEVYAEQKSDYESDVDDPDELLGRKDSATSIDSLEDIPLALRFKKRKKEKTSTQRKSVKSTESSARQKPPRKASIQKTYADEDGSSDDGMGERLRQFEPTREMESETYLSNLLIKSMRKYYGVDESMFVMDAKDKGNIGRYLNHSCQPNIFVQNVFVDTHDPRFPWISFFAMEDIIAGTELTWDYNYEVNSVPGRIKYCYCRSATCRGRLL